MFEGSGGSGVLDELDDAIDHLQSEDLRSIPLNDLVADIARLHGLMQRLQASLLAMARISDRDGGHHLACRATTGAMLTDDLRLPAGAGQAMVHTARALALFFNATGEALAAGEISYAHAAAITRAQRKLPATRLAEAEELLLAVARVGSPSVVRAAVDRMAELLDPQTFDKDDNDERERRYLDVSQTKDGWWAVDGHLPPETGKRLSAALEEFAAPAGPRDLRTARQRRADAVADIADAAVDGETTGISSVMVIADADRMDGRGATWDESGMPIGQSTFAMSVCQSRITLVAARSSGVGWKPLAVGRLSRFATPAQRAALRVRDGGCVFRGCTRSARRCHAHHVVDWRDGGLTDLPNLVLLCAYHHRMIHLGRAMFVEDPQDPERRIAVPARRRRPVTAA